MRRKGYVIMGKLIGFVKPMSHIMLLAIFTGVLGFLASIFITIFGGIGIVKVLGFDINMSWAVLFGGVLAFGISRGILRYIEQLSNHFIAFKLLALIRNKVFTALRKLSPAKLEGRDKGDLISLITSDIELIEVFYAHTISPIIIAFLTSFIMVVFIGMYSYILGIIALVAYLTIGVVIPIIASRMGSQEGLKYRNEFGDMNSYVLDSLRGLDEIIQYDLGENRLKQMNEKTNSLGQKQKTIKKYEGRTSALTDVMVLAFSAIMLFVGVVLYNKGIIGFKEIVITTVAMMSSFGPVLALSSLSGNLRYTLASGDRVLDLLEEQPVVVENMQGKVVQFDGAKSNNVTFGYGDEIILQDYSLDIPKNKIIGIYGKSGSGKSTLLKLLMRFWDVDKGAIEISNENIKDINTNNLRDIQSYVTQQTHLFNDTIANNIAIGKKDATIDEIIQSAKKASIHDFILTLPNGYDTNVGELGDNMSSGEKQRIGLARAFLHDSPFILLDEPTSNLDSLNEGIILKSLANESKDKTMILVSHRESTMNIADQVFQVDNDRVS